MSQRKIVPVVTQSMHPMAEYLLLAKGLSRIQISPAGEPIGKWSFGGGGPGNIHEEPGTSLNSKRMAYTVARGLEQSLVN